MMIFDAGRGVAYEGVAASMHLRMTDSKLSSGPLRLETANATVDSDSDTKHLAMGKFLFVIVMDSAVRRLMLAPRLDAAGDVL
jgi:hypothetical protein